MSILGKALLRRNSSPPGPTVLVSDDFSEANGTNLSGKLADTGQAWQVFGGTWTVNSGKVGTTSGYSAAGVDAGVANATVQVAESGTINGGLAFRITDNNNLYYLEQGGSFTLYKRVGGTFTQIASAAAVGVGTLTVILAGTSITAQHNGVTKITVTDSTYTTQTKHGIMAIGTGPTFDDFLVSA